MKYYEICHSVWDGCHVLVVTLHTESFFTTNRRRPSIWEILAKSTCKTIHLRDSRNVSLCSSISRLPSSQYALIIDGASLNHTISEHGTALRSLAAKCVAVLCCRMSPIQKAEVKFSDNAHNAPVHHFPLIYSERQKGCDLTDRCPQIFMLSGVSVACVFSEAARMEWRCWCWLLPWSRHSKLRKQVFFVPVPQSSFILCMYSQKNIVCWKALGNSTFNNTQTFEALWCWPHVMFYM